MTSSKRKHNEFLKEIRAPLESKPCKKHGTRCTHSELDNEEDFDIQKELEKKFDELFGDTEWDD